MLKAISLSLLRSYLLLYSTKYKNNKKKLKYVHCFFVEILVITNIYRY